jgi:hypothetical protein
LRKNHYQSVKTDRFSPVSWALLPDAGLELWPRLFHNLRASAETDLMDEYGLRKACQWAGNSAATAMKNYALIRREDFMDQGSPSGPKVDAKSDAIISFDAKSDAEPASTPKHGTTGNPIKNASGPKTRESECVLVGETGIEPARVTPLDPKSSASANSATRPRLV